MLASSLLKSQDLGFPMGYIIDGKDTVFVDDIPPAFKYTKPRFGKKGKSWRQYYRLVHNFAKAYPYALIAKEKLDSTNIYIKENNLSPREEERYLKNLEHDLFVLFEKPLRNLTVTQGKLLLRLIDRETGLSSYYLIKNYRGGAAAGFWQGIAKLFGSDLKTPYNKFGDDKQTEELVEIYQKGQFAYLYYSIFGKLPPKPIISPVHDYPQMMNR